MLSTKRLKFFRYFEFRLIYISKKNKITILNIIVVVIENC